MTSQILCISITLNKQFNLYELLLPVHSISYIRISQYILLINNFSILNTDYPVCISCNIRIMGYENNCFPISCTFLKTSIISFPVVWSSAPVGSSARRSSLSPASALAIAVLVCSPPDMCIGSFLQGVLFPQPPFSLLLSFAFFLADVH